MVNIFVLAAGLSLISAPARALEITRARYTMGTTLRVTLQGKSAKALETAVEDIFQEVDRWDRLLSTYKPDSEVSRINRLAPAAVAVSSDTLRAVAAAVEWARKTKGTFDPTLGPLVRLWGFDGPSPRLPSSPDIKSAKALVSYERVECSMTNNTVRLPEKGMSLDFGGVGKGWALDRAFEKVRDSMDMEEAVFDFGGQLFFWSRTPKTRQAAIRHPEKEGQTLAVFQVSGNGSLATSSFSERFFMAPDPDDLQGPRWRRYGHILDRRTGYPADGCVSVTVWAATAEEADAMTKPIFVMGHAGGKKFADERNIAAYILWKDGTGRLKETISRRWEKECQFTDVKIK